MNKLIVALPYHSGDHSSAKRLLQWISELETKVDHALLLVADDAVPMDVKREMNALGKTIFSHCETIMPKCPSPVNGNYHPSAAVMFERTAGHIDSCYKWNWLWMEPDCVPLRAGWLNDLSVAYDECPKRFMGSIAKVDQRDVPPTVMFATAVYPNCAHSELKQFCDGKSAFDMAFSGHVVPRAHNTPLIFHRFGSPTDVPTFKEVKMPTDGPNVGTLDIIPNEAVLFHRCKDGSLIDLLRKSLQETQTANALEPLDVPDSVLPSEQPEKRKGRYYPRKQPQAQVPQV